jgi:hypothetical protein
MLLRLLILSGLYAALAIPMKFLAISAKTVFSQRLSDLFHQL